MDINGVKVAYLIEIKGLYDGWSIAVMEDGREVNRWAGREGYERRAEAVEAYMRGEPANGRWYE